LTEALVLKHEWNETNEAPPDFFASIRFLRSIRGYLSSQLPPDLPPFPAGLARPPQCPDAPSSDPASTFTKAA
jgi:hypothetical protein